MGTELVWLVQREGRKIEFNADFVDEIVITTDIFEDVIQI